jgi:hypothetical protein
LLKVEPGVYDVGTTGIDIWGWMTLEGAGRELTKLTGAVCSSPSGVVSIGSGFSALRSIEIENTCSSALYVYAALVDGPDGIIEDARFECNGASTRNYVLKINSGGGGLRVNHVEVLAENGTESNVAIHNYGDGSSFEHVDAEAVGGGSATAFYNRGDSTTVRSSRLTASLATGVSRAFDSYSVSDLTLDRVIAEAVVGPDPSVGILLQEASTTLTGVRAIGAKAFDVYNCPSVSFFDVIADGAETGIEVDFSDVSVMHGVLVGGTNAVLHGIGGTVTLDGVIMRGGPASGAVTCTGCMRNGTFNATGCP